LRIPGNFRCYKGGIFESQCKDWTLGESLGEQWKEVDAGTRDAPNHAVTLIGFGEEECEETGEIKKYWKAKNSWGENWGESGFFRIIKKGNLAHCGFGAFFAVASCKQCDDTICKEHKEEIAENDRLPTSRPLPDVQDNEGADPTTGSNLGRPKRSIRPPRPRPNRKGRSKRDASYGYGSYSPAPTPQKQKEDLTPSCSASEVTECPVYDEKGKLIRMCPYASFQVGNLFCLTTSPKCRQATEAELIEANGSSSKQMCIDI